MEQDPYQRESIPEIKVEVTQPNNQYYQQGPPPVGGPNNGNYDSGKSKTTAGILGIIGSLLLCFPLPGIQYFYIGKPFPALISLAFVWLPWLLGVFISILTGGIGIVLLWAVGPFQLLVCLLNLVISIIMMCKSQEDFDQKYVYTRNPFPLF